MASDVLTVRCKLINCVRFEAFTAATMKNAVFLDITPHGSCKNRRFEGTYCLHLRRVRRLLVTANVFPSSLILALIMKTLRSSETSVLTRATRRNIPEEGIPHYFCLSDIPYFIPEFISIKGKENRHNF
jgi:hypothetical protein